MPEVVPAGSHDLSSELNDLRTRGIDLVDYQGESYQRLQLPLLDDYLRRYGLEIGTSRAVGLRHLLSAASTYCQNRRAIELMYGLDRESGGPIELLYDRALRLVGIDDLSSARTRTRAGTRLRAELAAAILEADQNGLRLRGQEAVSPRRDSEMSSRLLRWSELFAEDLAALVGVNPSGVDSVSAAADLYVERECQQRLVDRLLSGESTVEIIVGEAGAGKSSLLWGIWQALSERAYVKTVLISSTWIANTVGEVGIVTVPEIVLAVGELQSETNRTVVLIDTADLLLHSDIARLLAMELIESLARLDVAVALTTRPVEAAQAIPASLGRQTVLGQYSDDELERAVGSLIRRFCPDERIDDRVGDVRTALARGLPVREVCYSPLLLRMMFELAAPNFPPMAETDVTGLYRRYWEHRVEADLRNMPESEKSQSDDRTRDLSSVAASLGIALLALGTPEPALEAAVKNTQRVLRAARFTTPVTVTQGIAFLRQRGVLVGEAGRLKFFHQTLFEFAAAVGLILRGNSDETSRLTEHLITNPVDLFAGAVLEQVLILVGDDPFEAVAVSGLIERLIRSQQPTLQDIALAVCAHHPDLRADLAEDLKLVPNAALLRFTRIAPTIAGVDPTRLRTLLREVWGRRDSQCAHAVIDALVRMSYAYPQAVAELFDELDCVDYFLTDGHDSLANPTRLIDLIMAVAPSAPDSARSAALKISLALLGGGREHMARLLERIAENWPVLASEQFLRQISAVVRSAQTKKDARGRSVREALGALLFAYWGGIDGKEWGKHADETVRALEGSETDLEAGAGLFALAAYLKALPENHAGIDEVLNRIEAMPARAAPRRLTTHFFVPLLISQAPVRRAVAMRLAEMLDSLPTPPNEFVDEAGMWANVARGVLEDERLVPADVELVVGEMWQDTEILWSSRDYLVSVLPIAVRAGLHGAVAFVRRIASEPGLLTPDSQTKFMNESRRHLAYDDDIVTAVAAIAIERREYGAIATIVAQPSVALVLAADRATLSELVLDAFLGHGKSQRDGAGLWTALQRAGVLTPHVSDIREALGLLTDPIAKSVIVGMIPEAVQAKGVEVDEALALLGDLGRFVDGQMATPVGSGRPTAPSILDATAAVLLSVVARYQPVEVARWELIPQLCARERLIGSYEREIAGFSDANSYLTRLSEAGQSYLAAQRLVELGRLLESEPFSTKQRRDAANKMNHALQTIVRLTDDQGIEFLLTSISDVTPTLAKFIIRTTSQLHHAVARPLLERALSAGLASDLASYVATNLRSRGRELGSGLFAELLDPA